MIIRRLLVIGTGIVVLSALAVWIHNAATAPIDDPSYFCQTPDPSPVTSIAATTILEDCAAGKTFTVKKGETIAVDLQGGYGVDTSTEWTELVVSDGRVLSTVSAPARVGAPSRRLDEVAVYRANQTGQSTVSAVETPCTANFGGRCDRGHLWSVTIRVD